MNEELEKDMIPILIEDLGMRYPTEKSNYKKKYGLYECQHCNKEFESIIQNVKRGFTKSCGCQKNKQKITHGLTYNKFYNTWKQMRQRCYNQKHKNYKYYGARGITVCGEWQDVKNFVDWAEKTYPNIEGYTLDRIDNDKGYSPENCRWADKSTQAINQRIGKNNKSGYVGVAWYIRDKKWYATIKIAKKSIHIGSYDTPLEAAQARDLYIVENNLSHKLNLPIQERKKNNEY